MGRACPDLVSGFDSDFIHRIDNFRGIHEYFVFFDSFCGACPAFTAGSSHLHRSPSDKEKNEVGIGAKPHIL